MSVNTMAVQAYLDTTLIFLPTWSAIKVQSLVTLVAKIKDRQSRVSNDIAGKCKSWETYTGQYKKT